MACFAPERSPHIYTGIYKQRETARSRLGEGVFQDVKALRRVAGMATV